MKQIDIDFANQLAQMETYNKHYYRPNSYLHKWWARRCGSTFRLLLKALDDTDHDTVSHRQYYQAGGLEGMVILDPMMGGGTTLHEAIRLNANVIGCDIDPIPFLNARSALTDVPFPDLEKAFGQLMDALDAQIAPFFVSNCPTCQSETAVKYVLYGVRQYCQCRSVIKIDNPQIKNDTRLCSCGNVHHVSAASCLPPHSVEAITTIVDRNVTTCSLCNAPYQEEIERPYYQRYEPVVMILNCQTCGSDVYKRPDAQDIRLVKQANQMRPGLEEKLKAVNFKVNPGKKSQALLSRNVASYLDLFSSRQLLYISCLHDALQHLDDDCRLRLALLGSTSLEFNSLLCGYKGGTKGGAVRHVFARHAYTFPYTAVEVNPVYRRRASGTLPFLFRQRIKNAYRWAKQPAEPSIAQGSQKTAISGETGYGIEVNTIEDFARNGGRFLLFNQSAASLPLPANSVDHVVTDPPYFDSVQYSDLSAFFRAFLQLFLGADYPGVSWQVNDDHTAVAETTKEWEQYADVLGLIFAECARVLKADGRLIFTFHHVKPEAWAALTSALQQGGFALDDYYVIQSESPINCHINGMRALVHDVVLILKKKREGAKSKGRMFRLPARRRYNDSETFNDYCGQALGWMLGGAKKSNKDLLDLWQRLLS